MDTDPRVLILGASGRTGSQVLTQLLERGVPVRALVRAAARLPVGTIDNPLLEVVEADLLSLPPEVFAERLVGCDTVISCLGHTISVRGIFGPPRDLVRQAVGLVRVAVARGQREQTASGQPAAPVRLILMSSVSVNQPGRADARRGASERAYMWAMRALVPPARDNQIAADFLVHEVLVSSLFKPDRTRMSQVAHFMCELATDDATWQRWRSRMPVVVGARLSA
jgi:nucleoside-diphosphate-sugar epimerase